MNLDMLYLIIYFELPDSTETSAACFNKLLCFMSCCALIMVPRPTATAPAACTAPDARRAPPAPPAMKGRAGMLPTVMRTAAKVDITLGCSVVSRSRAPHASNSQAGTSVIFVKSAEPC